MPRKCQRHELCPLLPPLMQSPPFTRFPIILSRSLQAALAAVFFAVSAPLHAADSPAGNASPAAVQPPDPPLPPPPPSDSAEEQKPLRFRLEVDAPRAYRKLLEERLPLSRWEKSERVTLPLLERLVAEARREATEALATDGYFSAKVTSTIDTSGEMAVVRLNVDPGPRTRVKSVDLDFTGPATQDAEGRDRIDAVRKTWRLAPGEPFVDAEWNAAKDAALARLSRGRYAAAKITDSEARVVPEDSAAQLRLKLDSGPVFRAGAVNVTGLNRYPPRVVENFNPHRLGEPYDDTKLAQYQRRLLETGYFNAVQFQIDPDPDQSAAAPLNVQVIEAPSQRIDTGVSYSTDVGAGFSVDYGNADIFNSAHRFRSLLAINQKDQRLNLSVDTPPRPRGYWDTYSARLERSDVQNLVSTEAVAGYALNWGLERVPSQATLSYHYERLDVEGSTTRNNRALFAGYRKTFRTTEELVTPREGLIGTVELGVSVPGASTQDFARVRTLVNWLIPAGLRNDILVRGEFGYVYADDRFGIPSSFLFRTGGDQSIRGYQYQSIGIREGEAVVPGRYLTVGSIEYTRWVTDSLGAAAFVDAGDAFDDFDAYDVAVGVGVGVRWKSPIGPFRGDVAYGERDKSFRLHFSVGYSF